MYAEADQASKMNRRTAINTKNFEINCHHFMDFWGKTG